MPFLLVQEFIIFTKLAKVTKSYVSKNQFCTFKYVFSEEL